jgi:hypothetical protein
MAGAMAEPPDTALPWRWKIAASVALFAALLLLALVLAHWGWRWFGPPPAVIAPAPPDGDWARRIADAKLFGIATPQAGMSSSVPASTGELRLLGVFAQRDGKGYALFRSGAREALIVAAGQDVRPGVRLDAVRPEGVTLLDGGVKREIVLRPTPAVDQPRSAAKPSATTGTKVASCAAPPGFPGQVVRLNAELMGGMINAPDAWKALLKAGTGALVVVDQSGFAGMMGLKTGDRVERANGIALALPDDIASTVLQPLMKSQPVFVEGARDGERRQWLYLNAGACPG